MTPGECWIVAAICWLVCWIVWARFQWRSAAALCAALAVAALVAGQVERLRRNRPVAVVVESGTAVRAAPYGGAGASARLEPGAAVLLVDQFAGGRWVRVSRSDGINGWVLASQVARL